MNTLLKNLIWGSAFLLQVQTGSAAAIPASDADFGDTSRVRKSLLKGRAILPAATFAAGPTSGKLLGAGPLNGQALPFTGQPVQGFSAILRRNDTTYWVMPDNGYGAIENSSDFNLRLYTINPSFKTKTGGSGQIAVKSFIQLRDPDKKIPFAITNNFSAERILTGADFDIESVQRISDGTLYFGDEFGPFLLHTDSTGKVLDAPFPLPDFENPGKEIRSPQNPFNEEISALRVMNAFKSNASAGGSSRVPVISPNFLLVDDADTTTAVASRRNPAAGSGLPKASSELFNITSLKQAGFPVVAWTVNDTTAMKALLGLGVNGIISDRPDLLRKIVEKYDQNKDGIADFIDSDGLINQNLFDAQGHRGGRSLRPENTLPAMESGLDNLINTLETDCGITSDGVPVLNHDPHIEAIKFRHTDGTEYTAATQVLIKNLTLAQIQSTFIGDKLLADRPDQKNDRALSPVAVAFASQNKLADPYIMPTLQQLFDFINYYVAYYKTGAGKDHTDATRRWKNAEKVRFNVETKINPRTDTDLKGDVFAERTVLPEPFANAVAGVIISNKLEQRADIQSFDFRTLKIVQDKFPAIRTVFLFDDSPRFPGSANEGGSLQATGTTSPWLGGLYWPYRSSNVSNPTRSLRSGGFEGMALDSLGKFIYPLLEKPLKGHPSNRIIIHEFDLSTKTYTGKFFKYIFQPRGVSIGDFVLFGKTRGLIIERDDSQGTTDAFKAIYEIQMNLNGEAVSKRLAVDLMNIRDTSNLTSVVLPGDIAVGPTFGFPFQTIEDVVVLSPTLIGVLNDNNYPFGLGRHKTAGVPDDNEFIQVQLDRVLGSIPMTATDTIGDGGAVVTGLIFGNNGSTNRAQLWNFPNPFTKNTEIRYVVNQNSFVAVTIYNNLGQEVKKLVREDKAAGEYGIQWDALDEHGSKCRTGMYIYTLQYANSLVSGKLMLKD